MAECHPVGFQWVMEAKARGAKVIHIDPRFTRTSAVSDLHVPLRAGSDIALLGGIVNYILRNEKYFREYVLAYTNASVILREDFRDVDDLDGVFSGYNPETGVYDTESWSYAGVEGLAAPGDRKPTEDDEDSDESEESQTARGAGHELGGHGAALETGETQHDPTLQNPRCVFQVLKRHYARYTPEMVADVCGVSIEDFEQICRRRHRQQRPRTNHRVGLFGRLDASFGRRAIHPGRSDHPVAARKHGTAGRRHPGAARACIDPGIDRHPDAVQPAAGLSSDAQGR